MLHITRDDCVSEDSKLMLEKVRHHLKNAGIENLRTIGHDYYNWIMKGTYWLWHQSPLRNWGLSIVEDGVFTIEPIRIYILMRKTDSDKVAMNRGYYEIEMENRTNPLLVLSDVRKEHTPKFAFLNYLENKEYKNAMTPIVLFPEEDFSNMKELKMILDIE